MGSMMTSLLVPFANAGDAGTVALAVWAVLTLIAAIVLYAVCPPKTKASEPRGFRAFLSLDHHCAASVTRFLYLLGSVGGLTFLVASVVVLFMGGYVEPPIGYLVALVAVVAVFEVLLRIACELVVLVVAMAENTAALRVGVDGLATEASRAPQEGASPEVVQLMGELGAQVEALARTVAGVAAPQLPVVEAAAVEAPQEPRQPERPEPAEEPSAPVADNVVGVTYVAQPIAQPEGVAAETTEVLVEVAQPPMTARYEEIPAVFDATTYDEYASRGAFEPYEELVEEVPPTYMDSPAEVYGYGYPAWDCPCGSRGNTGAFCGNCGRPRPR